MLSRRNSTSSIGAASSVRPSAGARTMKSDTEGPFVILNMDHGRVLPAPGSCSTGRIRVRSPKLSVTTSVVIVCWTPTGDGTGCLRGCCCWSGPVWAAGPGGVMVIEQAWRRGNGAAVAGPPWAGLGAARRARRGYHDYLLSLGASEVVDYHDADWAQQVRAVVSGGVNLLFDGAGGQTRDQALDAVRDGGRAISIVLQGTPLQPERGITGESFAAHGGRPRLEQLAALVDAGKLRPQAETVLPLDQAREALARVAARHTRGKIALQISGLCSPRRSAPSSFHVTAATLTLSCPGSAGLRMTRRARPIDGGTGRRYLQCRPGTGAHRHPCQRHRRHQPITSTSLPRT